MLGIKTINLQIKQELQEKDLLDILYNYSIFLIECKLVKQIQIPTFYLTDKGLIKYFFMTLYDCSFILT